MHTTQEDFVLDLDCSGGICKSLETDGEMHRTPHMCQVAVLPLCWIQQELGALGEVYAMIWTVFATLFMKL